MAEKQGRWLLASILALALLHGILYASLMPPWGLLDEEQHLHYVQHLVEERAIPTVGTTMLSAEIIDSAFDTERWAHFGWPAPPSRDPLAMGLEGHSYEGYQPPLYYAVMAPLYRLLPGTVLDKLYALRWATVALSLLSVFIVFRVSRLLAGGAVALPYLAALLMAVIPERTAAISRVNNDVALEVAAAALVWVCTLIALRGLTWRRSLLLGLLFGLTMLAKISGALLIVPVAGALWMARGTPRLGGHVMLAGVAAAAPVVPWMARNLRVYGDLTGSSGFARISPLQLPAFSWQGLLGAIWDLFRHFWFVWWKGAVASGNAVTLAAQALLTLLVVVSVAGLYRSLWGRGMRRPISDDAAPRRQVLLIFAAAVAAYGLVIVLGYFGSNFPLFGNRVLVPVLVPVIQGRYFLPVVVPAVILFCWGLAHVWQGDRLVKGSIALLAALSLLSLFGNLLPYHYYWSPLAARGELPMAGTVALPGRGRMLVAQLISHKPASIRAVLPWLLPLFTASGIAAAATARRSQRLA